MPGDGGVHSFRTELSPVPRDTGMARFAVIDAAHPGGHSEHYLPASTEARRLRPRTVEDPDALPWLVPLAGHHAAWLQDQAARKSWGILVESSLALEPLADALSDCLLAVDPDGTEALLRYYDPVVLGPLLRSFDRYEASGWFPPDTLLGRIVGAEIEWFAPWNKSTDGTDQSGTTPLRIRREHLCSFTDPGDHALVDEVSAFLEAELPGSLDAVDDDTRQVLVRTGIQRARSHGIEDTAEIAAFVAIMLDVGPNFDEQAEIRSGLRLSLRDALQGCSEEAWEEADSSGAEAEWSAGPAELSPDERGWSTEDP